MDYISNPKINHAFEKNTSELHNLKVNLNSEKTSGLCNLEANQAYGKKRFSDCIIQKLISCIEKTSKLCSPKANYKRLPDYIIWNIKEGYFRYTKTWEMTQESMEVQEKAIRK